MPEILPRPKNLEDSLKMWVDEEIWGHRLYDEQTPWLCLLEFLTIAQSELQKGRAFREDEHNTLKYSSKLRLYLRNILFNNPQLEAIQEEYPDDKSRWEAWCNLMEENAGGISSPNFSYLKKRFASFKDFIEVVKFLRSSAIEGDSNKRWSSKFVFPYGPNCLYEDLRVQNNSKSNDRRFFARTGELLYLMICRSGRGVEILFHLKRLLIISEKPGDDRQLSKWDRLVLALQPENGETRESGTPPYLPYQELPEYTNLADDWLNLFRCNMPDYDSLPNLATITGLHLIIYLLSRAKAMLVESKEQPTFILEIVAPKRTVVRDLASDTFLKNDTLSQQAVKTYIKKIANHLEWQECKTSDDPIGKAASILKKKFAWSEEDEAEGARSPDALLNQLLEQAIVRHQQHLNKCHRNWAREIGLSSSRGSRRTRYAPTDSLLKTLVLCTVPSRMEFQTFLAELHRKYGFIIGDRQAIEIIGSGSADQEAFSDNADRLEQRLASIGLLKRLSDACAYVQNPFAGEQS